MAYIDDPATRKANLAYIKTSMKEPMLSREEEHDLATAWRDEGDEASLHRLVKAYARLVISTASRFRNYGLPMGDLLQEGNVGLMQAASRFEPKRDVRFSTYASWWIRSAIQDYVLRNWSIVRTGTTAAQKSLFFNFRRLRARIDDHSNGHLTTEGRMSIAEELNVNLSDVEEMEGRLSSSDQSLNAPITESGDENWQNFLADTRPDPESVITDNRDNSIRSVWLKQAVSDLSDREQVIIMRRRLSEDGATLEELGKSLGVSKERVRQLEQRAMSKLKQSLVTHVESEQDLVP